MKSCAACIHHHRFRVPIEGRGLHLTGICAHGVKAASRAPVVADNSGSMCSSFEAKPVRVEAAS